jgi:putative ABC transport system permease protein
VRASISQTIVIQGGECLVVGLFDLEHTEEICVAYADADTVLSAFGRNSYNQVNIMLHSPAALATLVDALKANPTLKVVVRHEAELAEENRQQVNGMLNFVSYFVGSIVALAATMVQPIPFMPWWTVVIASSQRCAPSDFAVPPSSHRR